MNALRFQPIYVTLPPVSLQAILLEDCSGRGAGLAHTPHLSWKPEGPRSVLAVTDRLIGKKSGRSRCGFSQLGSVQFPSCTAISRAPGHSETIRGAASLAGTAQSPSYSEHLIRGRSEPWRRPCLSLLCSGDAHGLSPTPQVGESWGQGRRCPGPALIPGPRAWQAPRLMQSTDSWQWAGVGPAGLRF